MSEHEEYVDQLIGKTFEGLWVSNDGETTLRIDYDGISVYLYTEGDCCSESWWADILGAQSCLGGEITGFRELDMPNPDDGLGRSRQEYDIVYGFALDTTKGTVTLAFRNSSNGYYGGWAEFAHDSWITDWVEIDTNNWSA